MAINIEELIEELRLPANTGKPWMTASFLAKRKGLGASYAGAVEECLLAYYKKAVHEGRVPEIRYSSLPGKKSLNVLWGHTKFVGNRRLTDLKRTDVADQSLDVDEDITTADVFISHSFKDYIDVIEIGKFLQQESVKPWLAETHIQQGEHIHQEVIGQLKSTQCFALFLSENSLASKWTGKEYLYARSRGIQIVVIADCRSPVIWRIVENKLRGEFHPMESPPGDAAHFFNDLFSDEEKITHIVVYPENFWQKVHPNDMTKIFPTHQLAGVIKEITGIHPG